MITERELEEELKLTESGQAFVETAKSSAARVAIVDYGKPDLAAVAKMIANGEGIKIEINGDLK